MSLTETVSPPTIARIDLERIRQNFRSMQRLAGGSRVVAVVKANAYGHGAVPVTRALKAAGADFFAVAHLQEALELRRAGVDDDILVMGLPEPNELRTYADWQIDVVVGSGRSLKLLSAGVGGNHPLNVHVKVDTGMRRLGFEPAEATPAVETLASLPHVRLRGLWTHLAASDEPESPFTDEQLKRFQPAMHDLGRHFEYVHIGASSGVLHFPRVSLPDTKSLVRLGISLYGYLEDDETSMRANLSPALQLVSRVVQTRTVGAGETVSYNRTWRAPEPLEVATIAAGYADGYPRSLSNRAQVGISGKRYPVAGTICMDMFMVRVGRPGSPSPVRAGDPVVLVGEGGPSAFEVADWANTIVYEICTGVSGRVTRQYV